MKMKIVISSFLAICLLKSTLSSEQQSQVKRHIPRLRAVDFELKDGIKFELNLEPVDRIVMSDDIPVWVAKTERDKSSYQKIDPTESRVGGTIYHDQEHLATLLGIDVDGHGHIHYNGIIGDNDDLKVVKAVPGKLRNKSYPKNSNHFIFNASSRAGQIAPFHPNGDKQKLRTLDKPLDTFYPKLFIVVDYSIFKTLKEDVQETIRYVATFWNAVNLRYSQIDQPKIKILVTGLVIGGDTTAFNYIYRNRYQNNKVNYMNILSRGGYFFQKEFYESTNFDNYDAIITMADFFGFDGAVGNAIEGEICSDLQNVVYVRDDGHFAGIITAIHELGHSLSLTHDDVGNRKYCVDKLSDLEATIMGDNVHRGKKYVWSECSKKELQEFAWNEKSSCLGKTSRSRH